MRPITVQEAMDKIEELVMHADRELEPWPVKPTAPVILAITSYLMEILVQGGHISEALAAAFFVDANHLLVAYMGIRS